MLNVTHPFTWIYNLPSPFIKIFESFWKRLFCSKGIHLYDYVYNGFSYLSCDACGHEIEILDYNDDEGKLFLKLHGLIKGPIETIKEIKRLDPNALVLDINNDNDISNLLLEACTYYLLVNVRDYETFMHSDRYVIMNLVNILNQRKRVLTNLLFRDLFVDANKKPIERSYGNSALNVRPIKDIDENGWYNGEIVIMSKKLKDVWRF